MVHGQEKLLSDSYSLPIFSYGVGGMLVSIHNIQTNKLGFERFAPFNAGCVASIMPEGFKHYARIFHSARRVEPEQLVAIRWEDMAKYTGNMPHALMQWENISAPSMDGVAIEPPEEGTLPLEVSHPLREILMRHSPSDKCWMGVWRGYGALYRRSVPAPVFIDTGARQWDLFQAPLSMMDTQFFVGGDQTANLIWCSSLSWWVTAEVDLNTTYIGGNEELIQAVLESSVLEAWPAAPSDDISRHADIVNPVRPENKSFFR